MKFERPLRTAYMQNSLTVGERTQIKMRKSFNGHVSPFSMSNGIHTELKSLTFLPSIGLLPDLAPADLQDVFEHLDDILRSAVFGQL